MNYTIATPRGYELHPAIWAIGQRLAAETGAELRALYDPLEAVRDADVVYTDTWTSMGQEEETQKRQAVFPPYRVDESKLAHAKEDVMVMHCLPAHRGEEITDAVADGPHSALFDQAENRLHAQKAILVWTLEAA
jgi:ornithine carbamoyltransferase